MANFWYDPRHRDLYLKYSAYLAVIDNIKQHELEDTNLQADNDDGLRMAKIDVSTAVTGSTTTASRINDDTPTIIEQRVTAAIEAVAAATVKIAENHNDNNSDGNSVKTDIDTVMAVVSANDNYCTENNNSNNHIKKLGLTKLQRLILIGGPDDGVISPWQSRYLLFILLLHLYYYFVYLFYTY